MANAATMFDGISAQAWPVTVSASGAQIAIAHDEGAVEEVDPALLMRIDGGAGAVRFGRHDLSGWRLRFAAAPDAALAALLPGEAPRYGRWIDRVGLLRAATGLALAAAAVVAIGYAAPSWIAPLLPAQWERNLGQALVGDFGRLRCGDSNGNAALSALAERLEPGVTARGNARAIRFTAIDVPMFNAAALPGGQIVIFRPMLARSDPDALAGVVAHEVAHVRRRHVTEALIRELGIGALLRLFAGGIGTNAEQLVALSYTRANEAEADRDSIAMLRRAGIDPRPTARLFSRLARESGERDGGFDANFLRSHPVSRERARLFAASYRAGTPYRPALSRGDAAAAATMCGRARR